MAALIDKLIAKASAAYKSVVLPEGQDPRVIEAARQIAAMKMAKVLVLATPAELPDQSIYAGLDVEVIDWTTSPWLEEFANDLYERRKAKGMTLEQASKAVLNRLYFANLMMKTGKADSMVAGSIASTADMLRSSFHCIGTAPGIKSASSCFIMDLKTPAPNGENTLVFADCGVIPNPDADTLVDIALATIKTTRALLDKQPRVSFLCYSSKGSASGELVAKMQEAAQKTIERVKAEGIDAIVDGELQADASIVPSVATSKAPDSPLKGTANVLIFPDLNCGNICYKLVQRLAQAEAYGPILQGIAKPVSDLSRGCTAEDIVGVAAITICEAL
ncbi:MAG: phosphate acetyltransferase [Victivallales bacterium]|nr:phosphate acetyltransferase [Victivallales bacterium]